MAHIAAMHMRARAWLCELLVREMNVPPVAIGSTILYPTSHGFVDEVFQPKHLADLDLWVPCHDFREFARLCRSITEAAQSLDGDILLDCRLLQRGSVTAFPINPLGPTPPTEIPTPAVFTIGVGCSEFAPRRSIDIVPIFGRTFGEWITTYGDIHMTTVQYPRELFPEDVPTELRAARLPDAFYVDFYRWVSGCSFLPPHVVRGGRILSGRLHFILDGVMTPARMRGLLRREHDHVIDSLKRGYESSAAAAAAEAAMLAQENMKLAAENRGLAEEAGLLIEDSALRMEENERLAAENRELAAENERLAAENQRMRLRLEEEIAQRSEERLRAEAALPRAKKEPRSRRRKKADSPELQEALALADGMSERIEELKDKLLSNERAMHDAIGILGTLGKNHAAYVRLAERPGSEDGPNGLIVELLEALEMIQETPEVDIDAVCRHMRGCSKDLTTEEVRDAPAIIGAAASEAPLWASVALQSIRGEFESTSNAKIAKRATLTDIISIIFKSVHHTWRLDSGIELVELSEAPPRGSSTAGGPEPRVVACDPVAASYSVRAREHARECGRRGVPLPVLEMVHVRARPRKPTIDVPDPHIAIDADGEPEMISLNLLVPLMQAAGVISSVLTGRSVREYLGIRAARVALEQESVEEWRERTEDARAIRGIWEVLKHDIGERGAPQRIPVLVSTCLNQPMEWVTSMRHMHGGYLSNGMWMRLMGTPPKEASLSMDALATIAAIRILGPMLWSQVNSVARESWPAEDPTGVLGPATAIMMGTVPPIIDPTKAVTVLQLLAGSLRMMMALGTRAPPAERAEGHFENLLQMSQEDRRGMAWDNALRFVMTVRSIWTTLGPRVMATHVSRGTRIVRELLVGEGKYADDDILRMLGAEFDD